MKMLNGAGLNLKQASMVLNLKLPLTISLSIRKEFSIQAKTALVIQEELFYFMKEKATSVPCASLYVFLFAFKSLA